MQPSNPDRCPCGRTIRDCSPDGCTTFVRAGADASDDHSASRRLDVLERDAPHLLDFGRPKKTATPLPPVREATQPEAQRLARHTAIDTADELVSYLLAQLPDAWVAEQRGHALASFSGAGYEVGDRTAVVFDLAWRGLRYKVEIRERL